MSGIKHMEAHELPVALLALPPFPSVALKALRLMSRPDSRLRELHDLIRADPVFSGEILRIVNSPLFPFPTAISSTLQAVMLLGFERVQSLAVAIGVRTYLKDTLDVPALKACWRHSLACAIVAEQLSPATLADKEAAFTAGMLHDIGRLALVVSHRRQYGEFLCLAEVQPCDVLAREQQLFGVDHCQAGEALIRSWNLPEKFAEIAARHHEDEGGGNLTLLSLVQQSCVLAELLGYGVTRSLDLPTFEQLHARLPAGTLPADPKDFAARIAAEMEIIERS